jgi:hypothetical protein
VDELVDLVSDRGQHARVAAADVQDTQPAGEIDELVAVDIGDFGAVSGSDEDWNRVENCTRHRSLASFAKVSRIWARHCLYDLSRHLHHPFAAGCRPDR